MIPPSHPYYPPWVYHNAFGIVHYYGCSICYQYMWHLSTVDKNDIGYASAVRTREADLGNRYLEEFRRAQNVQQQRYNNLLKEYQSQLDSTRDSLSRSECMLTKAKEKINQLHHELLTYKAVDDKLHLRTLRSEGDSDSEDEVLRILNDGFDSSASDMSLATTSSSSSSEFSPGKETPSFSSARLELNDEEDMGNTVDTSRSSWTGDSVGVVCQPPPTALIEIQQTSFPRFPLQDTQINANNKAGPNGNVDTYLPSARFGPPSPRLPVIHSRSEYETVEDIREKMKLARHPDNHEILAHIKLLVSKAHSTSAWRRTEVQKVLLSEWKRPMLFISTRNHRVLGCPPDVYVDASQIGIGFIFRGQWQAWELKRGWKTGGRRIQWAEAIAVELGLRLMIQAGYWGRTLRLRSDNRNVVETISRRVFPRSPVGDIAQHIDDLCWRHNITLKIKWIPGADNPADAPSRLRTRNESLRFPYSIDIPSHLQQIILPYIPPTMCVCGICLRARRIPRNHIRSRL